MKKTISICLFTVILAVCIIGSVILLNTMAERQLEQNKIADATERQMETEQPKLAESMQVQEAYRYLLIEENGVLIVYEQDAKTVFLEINIRPHGLDEDTRRLLQEGIWIKDEKELYDILESYSS